MSRRPPARRRVRAPGEVYRVEVRAGFWVVLDPAGVEVGKSLSYEIAVYTAHRLAAARTLVQEVPC